MMAKTEKGPVGPGFWKIASVVTAVSVVLIGFAALTAAAAQEQAGIRASKLMDHPVVDSKGKEILEIDDLILRRNGNVKRVILSCCGFLGLGSKRVAVPFRRLQFEGNKIVYDVTEEQFTQMAEFNYAQEGLYTGYYSARPRTGREGPGTERGQYQTYPYYGPYYPGYWAEPEPGNCHWEWSYSPGMLLCSAVLNRPVVNNQCQRIGFVDDLIIDPDGGVKDIILTVMRPNVNLHRVSAPYKPLKVTYWGLVYGISIQELRKLPEFHYQEGK
jgi:sporulation protein YlmC with PRC-barrel domain